MQNVFVREGNASLFLCAYESNGVGIYIYVCVSLHNIYLPYGGALFKAAIKMKNNFNSQLLPARRFTKATE